MADKRRRILDAARARFRHFGIHKSSMREIAKDAGVAVGTVYLYFKNKDALVLAFVHDFKQRHESTAEALLASDKSPAETIRQYMLERFRASKATRSGSPFAKEITAAVLRCCPQRLQEESAVMQRLLATWMRQGQEQGLFEFESLEQSLEVFLYSTAWFFPTALDPLLIERREPDFLKVVDWFLKTWSQ